MLSVCMCVLSVHVCVLSVCMCACVEYAFQASGSNV